MSNDHNLVNKLNKSFYKFILYKQKRKAQIKERDNSRNSKRKNIATQTLKDTNYKLLKLLLKIFTNQQQIFSQTLVL